MHCVGLFVHCVSRLEVFSELNDGWINCIKTNPPLFFPFWWSVFWNDYVIFHVWTRGVRWPWIASKKRFHFLVFYFMVWCATWCWLVSVKAAYCCICCRQLTYLLRGILLAGFIVTTAGVPRTLTQWISKLFYNANIWHDNRLQIGPLTLRFSSYLLRNRHSVCAWVAPFYSPWSSY